MMRELVSTSIEIVVSELLVLVDDRERVPHSLGLLFKQLVYRLLIPVLANGVVPLADDLFSFVLRQQRHQLVAAIRIPDHRFEDLQEVALDYFSLLAIYE